MATRVTPGPVQNGESIREAVCVHTSKIYDSCRDKDCLEDLRVYLTSESQSVVNSACNIRARSAELLYIMTNVEEVSFKRGCYTVDMRFYYRIRGEAYSNTATPAADILGLAVFNKRVILFGSEGNAKVFSSDSPLGTNGFDSFRASNLPTAVVEAVDPIILDLKLVEACNCGCFRECDLFDVPAPIAEAFGSELVVSGDQRRVYVSLGQFSIVRLERNSQLLIPTYDYCMPEKECTASDPCDPCSIFSQVSFPVDEFFPPDTISPPECYREALTSCGR